jgi:hypothetical protein
LVALRIGADVKAPVLATIICMDAQFVRPYGVSYFGRIIVFGAGGSSAAELDVSFVCSELVEPIMYL